MNQQHVWMDASILRFDVRRLVSYGLIDCIGVVNRNARKNARIA